MEWMHKAVKITLAPGTGSFHAQVPGNAGHLTAPSLAAIKKQIDTALERVSEFEPFDSIDTDSGKIVANRVTELRKRNARYTYGSEYEFVIQESGKYARTSTNSAVIPDTPENRRKLLAYKKLDDESAAEIERLRKAVGDARVALPWLSADDIAVKKVKS